MELRERYRRLTLWNKLSVWGSVASLIGLAVAAWTLWPTDDGVVSGINALIGRDSFVYVVPQPHDQLGNVPLAIRSVGINPLTGVRLTIRDVSLGAPLYVDGQVVEVGTMPADTVQGLPGIALKASPTPGTRVYAITISTQAGEFEQEVRLRTEALGDQGCLSDMLVVTRRPRISEIGARQPVILKHQDWHYYVPCKTD